MGTLSFDTLFGLGGQLVMPFWVLMIALPHWRWTKRIIRSPFVVVPPALIYAALVLPQAAQLIDNFGGLNDVAALLGTPFGATAGWMHFLAFDLFVGRWAYLDSRERNISAWVMAPVLFLTFMFGPVGLLLYLGVRLVYSAVRTRHAGRLPLSTNA